MKTVIPLRAFKDNYIWLIVIDENAWVVDPGDAVPVIKYLNEQHLQLKGILITHHHADHAGGIKDLLKEWSSIPVYGFSQKTVPLVSHTVKQNDTVDLGAIKFNVLEIPGHTLDHVAYYNDEMVFTGDTLFSAGCGRVFEGTHAQMYQSLMKLAQLPMHLKVYCGHEYTLQNLKFASLVEPENSFIQEKIMTVKSLLAAAKPSLPSTLSDEKNINPFLRCSDAEFKALRDRKDQF